MNHLHIITGEFQGGSCLNYPPRNFNWVFNNYPANNQPVVYFNSAIEIGVKDSFGGPKYGWLGESSELSHDLLTHLKNINQILKQKYKKIFVNDKRIVDLDPNFFVHTSTINLFEKIFEANEYLDKKYGENVPENESTKAGRRALFGEKPEVQTQAAKYVTNTLGKHSYAKGGSASSRADGIAQRGKTRGTLIK
jgi:hypothetical protein